MFKAAMLLGMCGWRWRVESDWWLVRRVGRVNWAREARGRAEGGWADRVDGSRRSLQADPPSIQSLARCAESRRLTSRSALLLCPTRAPEVTVIAMGRNLHARWHRNGAYHRYPQENYIKKTSFLYAPNRCNAVVFIHIYAIKNHQLYSLTFWISQGHKLTVFELSGFLG